MSTIRYRYATINIPSCKLSKNGSSIRFPIKMSNIFEIAGSFLLAYPAWSSVIIALAVLLQGEIAVLLAVTLIVSGNLSWSSYLIGGVGGLFVGETFVYIVGRFFRNTRIGWKLYRKQKGNRKIQLYTYYLKKNLGKLFIASKFLVGTTVVIMLLSGWSKIKWGEFLKSHTLSVGVWFSAMTIISYALASGVFTLNSENIFKHVEIGMIASVALVFIAETLFRKFLKRKVFTKDHLAELEEEENAEK